MPDVKHSLVFASGLCDYDHTVEFTIKKCVLKKENYIVGVAERAGEMYSVKLQRLSDRETVILVVTEDMPSVWHARLAHADRNAINKMAWSDAVYGMEVAECMSMNSCSPCVVGTMKNTFMRSGATLETRPGAVL